MGQYDNSSQMTSSDIIERLRQCLPGILEQHPVLLAYVYGSVANGASTRLSDVDIALVLDPACDLDPYDRFMLELEIESEIEQICGIRNADVRSMNDAPLRVQGHVLTKGLLLFSKDEAFRVSYEVQIRKRYFDFAPVLKMMRKAYFARMEQQLRERKPHG